jgi:chromosome segregation ATPase
MQTQMFGQMIAERRLRSTSRSLKELKDELRVVVEQLDHLTDEAHEKGIRSLVSETPLAAREFEEVERHRHVLEQVVARIRHQMADLESEQDSLLDRLSNRTDNRE